MPIASGKAGLRRHDVMKRIHIAAIERAADRIARRIEGSLGPVTGKGMKRNSCRQG